MPTYSYKCKVCGYPRQVFQTIAEHAASPLPNCPSCAFQMARDYRTDRPQPAPMWPEHVNPSTGTVVRTRQQLQSDMDRASDRLFEESGIEQRNVVVDRADMASLKHPSMDEG